MVLCDALTFLVWEVLFVPSTLPISGDSEHGSYSLTIAIWIFWIRIHHSASTPCLPFCWWCVVTNPGFVTCYSVLNECITFLYSARNWLWPPSAGTYAHQTINAVPIAHWPSTLQAGLWWYDELCRTILDYKSPLTLTTSIVWLWVACHPWEERKLQQLNHVSVTTVNILCRLNHEHHAWFFSLWNWCINWHTSLGL